MTDSEKQDLCEQAPSYLSGTPMRFKQADEMWQACLNKGDISTARKVLARLRKGTGLLDGLPEDAAVLKERCQQEALLTSKDPELGASRRHDYALKILSEELRLDDMKVQQDQETLGIAGGICKRRWSDLGQLKDLIRCSNYYSRGAEGPLGEDAYPQINAAFIDDVLAQVGEESATRQERAAKVRKRIVDELPVLPGWWNAASRAEALFGLKRYKEAAAAIVAAAGERPAPWKLETTARQLARLAHIHTDRPLDNPEIAAFFNALLPGHADAVRSVMVGKVGLALSGGGFRASFYHLGVLARLAELNVLQHVEVLSCVSGGSIVGAAYWLALRKHLLTLKKGDRVDYVKVVQETTTAFLASVATNVRGSVQPSLGKMVWRVLRGAKGALDPEAAAKQFDKNFYRPFAGGNKTVFMHDLLLTPGDHDTDDGTFSPAQHNWLRADKVPALVINATTVNTGHAWQFTPTWMGESPWAVHVEADTIPRLQWANYDKQANWTMELGRAVAASASVPMVFKPLVMSDKYPDVEVQLVDGGVHDNQGTVSLLAMNCNVILVSDACGQLLFEAMPTPGLKGVASYAGRSMATLMERIRLANFADLDARRQSGLLRGLMFLHMKAGLEMDTIRLPFSSAPSEEISEPAWSSGIRHDFQQALADLRTDLDVFSETESSALMACGYRMATKTFDRDLSLLTELSDKPTQVDWDFLKMVDDISSPDPLTSGRKTLLDDLRRGSKVEVFGREE